MKRTLAVTAALLVLWWIAAAPPPEITLAPQVVYGEETARAIAAVDRSTDMAASLQTFPSELPGHDDVVFLEGGKSALVSAMDGRIWKVDLATHAAEPFVDPPLMASGMHEAPRSDILSVYFCASHLHGERYPAGEAVGLYRLDVETRRIIPVVLRVPETRIDPSHPVVYADEDRGAPTLPNQDAAGGRPLAFCNDLEISEDGRRIYFSEPFAYEGASMGGGAVMEAVALAPNGRLWRYDLSTDEVRLIAEGFHFIDGILYDLHPSHYRESSVLVSQTPMFRLTRFHLRGASAGTAETVLDGLPGMPDGMDRDAAGNIWIGLLKERSGLLTWLHANPWIKPLLLRLPMERVPQSRRTAVLALSPDGTRPLYAASYEGAAVTDIASAIPGPDGIYLTPFAHGHRGIVRLPYPEHLQ